MSKDAVVAAWREPSGVCLIRNVLLSLRERNGLWENGHGGALFQDGKGCRW